MAVSLPQCLCRLGRSFFTPDFLFKLEFHFYLGAYACFVFCIWRNKYRASHTDLLEEYWCFITAGDLTFQIEEEIIGLSFFLGQEKEKR